jgi:hypothetical protein
MLECVLDRVKERLTTLDWVKQNERRGEDGIDFVLDILGLEQLK